MAVQINVAANQAALTASIQAGVQAYNQKFAQNNPINLSVNQRAFSQPLGRMTGDVKDFEAALAASNARVIAFGASTAVLGGVIRSFKELANVTIDVEKNLADINRVFGLTTSQLQKFSTDLFSVGKQTASSFDDASKAALEFSRQGLKAEEVLIRTKDALTLARVAGISTANSVDALTSTINGFAATGVTTSQILNKLVAVEQDFAVGAGDLAEALSRTGQAAQEAGVSLDQLNALVTAAQQSTARGGAVIGNALKTIFTRLQRTETLDQLEAFNIAVRDVQGNTLPAVTVLQNFAGAYKNLGDAQRAQLSEQVAGVYQVNILKAIVGDLNKSQGVYAGALQRGASATNEAEVATAKLNQTLDALLKQTATSTQQLANNIGKVTFEPLARYGTEQLKSLVESMNEILEGEGIGSTFANGLLKGIRNVIAGPGAIAAFFTLFKLIQNSFTYLAQALPQIAGITTETQNRKNIEQSILQIMQQQGPVSQALAGSMGNQAAQAQLLLQLARQQTAEYQIQSTLAKQLATQLAGQGVRVKGSGGLQVTRAGGYIPAATRIAEAVGAQAGGYAPGKVVKSPVGGVMNTAEDVKYVPGFAQPFINPPAGSKAGRAHRQNAISRTGVDPYMFRGFIPNFANTKYFNKNKDTLTLNATEKKPFVIPENQELAAVTDINKDSVYGLQYKIKLAGSYSRFSGAFDKKMLDSKQADTILLFSSLQPDQKKAFIENYKKYVSSKEDFQVKPFTANKKETINFSKQLQGVKSDTLGNLYELYLQKKFNLEKNPNQTAISDLDFVDAEAKIGDFSSANLLSKAIRDNAEKKGIERPYYKNGKYNKINLNDKALTLYTTNASKGFIPNFATPMTTASIPWFKKYSSKYKNTTGDTDLFKMGDFPTYGRGLDHEYAKNGNSAMLSYLHEDFVRSALNIALASKKVIRPADVGFKNKPVSDISNENDFDLLYRIADGSYSMLELKQDFKNVSGSVTGFMNKKLANLEKENPVLAKKVSSMIAVSNRPKFTDPTGRNAGANFSEFEMAAASIVKDKYSNVDPSTSAKLTKVTDGLLRRYEAKKNTTYSGFIPNFASMISSSIKGKGNISAIKTGKNDYEIEGVEVGKKFRGQGLGSQLYGNIAQKIGSGSTIKSVLLPQEQALADYASGKSIPAKAIFPQLSWAKMAKSSKLLINGKEIAMSDFESGIAGHKYNAAKLDMALIELVNSHASGFIPNFAGKDIITKFFKTQTGPDLFSSKGTGLSGTVYKQPGYRSSGYQLKEQLNNMVMSILGNNVFFPDASSLNSKIYGDVNKAAENSAKTAALKLSSGGKTSSLGLGAGMMSETFGNSRYVPDREAVFTGEVSGKMKRVNYDRLSDVLGAFWSANPETKSAWESLKNTSETGKFEEKQNIRVKTSLLKKAYEEFLIKNNYIGTRVKLSSYRKRAEGVEGVNYGALRSDLAGVSNVRNIDKYGGFIPNFAYQQAVMGLEESMSGNKAVFDSKPFPHIRNKSQPTFSSAISDHGGLSNALSDSMRGQKDAGLMSKGYVPNFAKKANKKGKNPSQNTKSSSSAIQVENYIESYAQEALKDIKGAYKSTIDKIKSMFSEVDSSVSSTGIDAVKSLREQTFKKGRNNEQINTSDSKGNNRFDKLSEGLSKASTAIAILGPTIAGFAEQAVFGNKKRTEMTGTERSLQSALSTGLTSVSTGAGIGAAFGPVGLGIGAAAGALVGFVSALNAAKLSAEELAEMADNQKQNTQQNVSAGQKYIQAQQEYAKLLASGASSDKLELASKSLSESFNQITDVKLADELSKTKGGVEALNSVLSKFETDKNVLTAALSFSAGIKGGKTQGSVQLGERVKELKSIGLSKEQLSQLQSFKLEKEKVTRSISAGTGGATRIELEVVKDSSLKAAQQIAENIAQSAIGTKGTAEEVKAFQESILKLLFGEQKDELLKNLSSGNQFINNVIENARKEGNLLKLRNDLSSSILKQIGEANAQLEQDDFGRKLLDEINNFKFSLAEGILSPLSIATEKLKAQRTKTISEGQDKLTELNLNFAKENQEKFLKLNPSSEVIQSKIRPALEKAQTGDLSGLQAILQESSITGPSPFDPAIINDLKKIYEEFNRSVDKQNRSNVNQLKLTDLQGRVEQIRAKTTEFQATLLQKQIQLLGDQERIEATRKTNSELEIDAIERRMADQGNFLGRGVIGKAESKIALRNETTTKKLVDLEISRSKSAQSDYQSLIEKQQTNLTKMAAQSEFEGRPMQAIGLREQARNIKSIDITNSQTLSKAISQLEQSPFADPTLENERVRTLEKLKTVQNDIVNGKLKEEEITKRLNKEELRNAKRSTSIVYGFKEGFDALRDEADTGLNRLARDTPALFRDGMVNAIKAAVKETDNLGDALLGVAANFLDTISSRLMEVGVSKLISGSGIESLFTAQKGGYIRAQSGMYISGTGTGDKYPAMLENGEYVLNRRAVMAMGGPAALDTLNFSAAPRFASGGAFSKEFNDISSMENNMTQMGLENDPYYNELTDAAKQKAAEDRAKKLADKQQKAAMIGSLVAAAATIAVGAGISNIAQNAQATKAQTLSGKLTSSAELTKAESMSIKPLMNKGLLSSTGQYIGGAPNTGFKSIFSGPLQSGQLPFYQRGSMNPFAPKKAGKQTGGLIGSRLSDTIPGYMEGGLYDSPMVKRYGIGLQSGGSPISSTGNSNSTVNNNTSANNSFNFNTSVQRDGSLKMGSNTTSYEQQDVELSKNLNNKIYAAVGEVIRKEKQFGGSLAGARNS